MPHLPMSTTLPACSQPWLGVVGVLRFENAPRAIQASQNTGSKISRGSKKTTKPRTASSSPTKTSKPDKSRVTNQGCYHSNYHDYQAVFLPNIEPRSIRRTRKLTPEGRAHAALVRKRGGCDSCRLGKRKVNLLNL